MMIASSKNAGGTFLLLGLSRENINRLVDHKPIQIARASHGDAVPAGVTIAIMFGETEADLKRQLEEAGVVDGKTAVKIDPRLKMD